MISRTRITTVATLALAMLGLILIGPVPVTQAQKTVIYAKPLLSPSLTTEGEWINTSGPLKLRDLRGKFVILDFWTYCCINCLHALPELKKLEKAYPKNLVVIGVHSPKFATEREAANVREAVVRHEIEHPVLQDAELALWRRFKVNVWPTLHVIDPEGFVVATHVGEPTFKELDKLIRRMLPKYRRKGVLDEKPLKFDLERSKARPTPLRFPGKMLADADGNRLFIADSGHNRIVIARPDGSLVDVIGSGAEGREDGGFDQASFDHPQGMALGENVLYVADTENHLIRQIDLKERRVTTIAGSGLQARDSVTRGGSPATRIRLSSPWDLWLHEETLFIAMAGQHQIWKLAPGGRYVGPFAGNAVEDIVDGRMLPRRAMELGSASFAQPSGLASDGKSLYVADSEGSSIRAVPFRSRGLVTTVVGTARLPKQRRLFTFGDRDGPVGQALLQHPLGVAYHDRSLYVADTYNNKIKQIDLQRNAIRTIAGDAQPGRSDQPARFDEPAGLSISGSKLYVADTNNHKIRVIDLQNGFKVTTVAIQGLTPPQLPKDEPKTTTSE